LTQTQRSPKLLGDALAELERAHEARGSECKADRGSRTTVPDYFSTHPATEERIRAAEDAAR
jgi:Zn-dependent protease with chaperone function